MQTKLLGARLSTNPDTAIVAHAQGVNGQCNETTTGKKFYVVDYRYMKGGIFAKKSIVAWADENGVFPVSAADYNEEKGLIQNAELVRFGTEDGVVPYEVDGKFVDNVTLLVFEDQDTQSVFNAWTKSQVARLTYANGQGSVDNTLSPEDELELLETELDKTNGATKKAKIQKKIDALMLAHPELATP